MGIESLGGMNLPEEGVVSGEMEVKKPADLDYDKLPEIGLGNPPARIKSASPIKSAPLRQANTDSGMVQNASGGYNMKIGGGLTTNAEGKISMDLGGITFDPQDPLGLDK